MSSIKSLFKERRELAKHIEIVKLQGIDSDIPKVVLWHDSYIFGSYCGKVLVGFFKTARRCLPKYKTGMWGCRASIQCLSGYCAWRKFWWTKRLRCVSKPVPVIKVASIHKAPVPASVTRWHVGKCKVPKDCRKDQYCR